MIASLIWLKIIVELIVMLVAALSMAPFIFLTRNVSAMDNFCTTIDRFVDRKYEEAEKHNLWKKR